MNAQLPLLKVVADQPMSPQRALVRLQAQIYREVKASGTPVKQLMTWLLDRRNLEAALDRVQDAAGADTPGPDGVAFSDIRNRPETWLSRLSEDLYHGRFRPSPPRFIEVPKHNKPGAFRKLGILNLRDRVVQAAIKQVLEPVLEPIFLSSSFGFRPGRSVPAALQRALFLLTPKHGKQPPYPWAVHLDVADCFDTVDHALLLESLGRYVSDADFLKLVAAVVEAGGTTRFRFWYPRRVGLVQGSALSPLLCNLALHTLDVAMRDFATANQGGVQMLRYADDLLVLARDRRLAVRAIREIRSHLGTLRQQLRDANAVPRPIEQGVEWLGVVLRQRPYCWTGRSTFGYMIPDAKVLEMLARLDEITTPPSSRISSSAFNPARWIVSINDQLREWRQAYLFADNSFDVFRTLDDHCRYRVGQLLMALTGCSRGNLKDYRTYLPRGFWTWEVDGVRLVVLSALAPHYPGRLDRPPPWMQPQILAEVAPQRPIMPPLPPPPVLSPSPATTNGTPPVATLVAEPKDKEAKP